MKKLFYFIIILLAAAKCYCYDLNKEERKTYFKLYNEIGVLNKERDIYDLRNPLTAMDTFSFGIKTYSKLNKDFNRELDITNDRIDFCEYYTFYHEDKINDMDVLINRYKDKIDTLEKQNENQNIYLFILTAVAVLGIIF